METLADKALRDSDWFQMLDTGLRAALRNAARLQRLHDGAAVYRQGDPPTGLYAVVEGQVRLISYSKEGVGFLLLLAGPGEWFGEVSTLDDGPRQQDAVSDGDSLVLRVSGGDLERIGAEIPLLWRAIGRLASLHQRAALQYIRGLISMPADGRVAALLHGLNNRQPGAVLSITHHQIAVNVGLTRQTVNACLRRLQRQGLIRLGYRSIEVVGDLKGPGAQPSRPSPASIP